MKKLVVLFMAAIMAVSLIGCAGPAATVAPTDTATTAATPTPKPAEATATPDAEPPAPETLEPITVSVWTGGGLPSGVAEINFSDTEIGKSVVATTGVDFHFNFVTGDAATAFNLKLADGVWEDIIKGGYDNIQLQQLIDAGAIMQLDKYFEDAANYPNLAAIPKEVIDYWRAPDGHIYRVPNAWHEEGAPLFWLATGWYVLPSIAEQVGVDYKTIKTMDDVVAFLHKVKDAGLKNADGLDIIPMATSASIGCTRAVITAFGVDNAGTGYSKVDGAWTHFRDLPMYKESFRWLNKLNQEGLLDKEFTSLTDEQLVERVNASRVALYVGDAWAFWNQVTGGPTAVTEFDMISFPHPAGVTKNGIRQIKNPYGGECVMLSAETQHADRLMKLFDYYETQGEYRGFEVYNGVLGVDWVWDDARGGAPYFKLTSPGLNESKAAGDYNKIFDVYGWQLQSFMPCPYKYDLNEYIEGNEGLAWIFKMNNFWFAPENAYWATMRDIDKVQTPADGKFAANSAALNDVDLQFRASLISAKSDADFEKVWNDYRDQLEVKGKWSEVDAEFKELYKSY